MNWKAVQKQFKSSANAVQSIGIRFLPIVSTISPIQSNTGLTKLLLTALHSTSDTRTAHDKGVCAKCVACAALPETRNLFKNDSRHEG